MRVLAARPLADEIQTWDALVIGSGVAGLSTTLGLSPRRVALLTKADLGGGSSSRWAQGGVAAAMSPEDSPELHAEDTLAAGAGLCDAERVLELTRLGPEHMRRLIEQGGDFDRDPQGKLLLGREGAHSKRRILHADGDATGKEMVRALVAEAHARPGLEVFEHTFVSDLVLSGERVVGVLARHPDGRTIFHRAPAVVLATGGFGQLYSRTTNPTAATGDGLALAARAGAQLADLEFVQFHPTALDVTSDPLPLCTEALRGEGALLVNDRGERFMPTLHPLAELAPRDIVARAIRAQQQEGNRVYLDATDVVGPRFPKRFPTVFEHCQHHGIDPRISPIPVTPAAHYAMAGIAVDRRGRASLPGLWACGEVTSTGVHGANRLASNSLLEALVTGAQVAEDIASRLLPPPRTSHLPDMVWRETGSGDETEIPRLKQRLRHLMWEHAGLLRRREGLDYILDTLNQLAPKLPAEPQEITNLWTLGRLVSAAALAREESRGSHCRLDFPTTDEALAQRQFWTYEPAAGRFPLVAVGADAVREIA